MAFKKRTLLITYWYLDRASWSVFNRHQQPDLLPASVVQAILFDSADNLDRSGQLKAALDTINRRHGKKSIRYASEIISNKWHMRQQFKSPSFTTNWQELLTVRI